MAESADKTASGEGSLDEESDVVELKDEVAVPTSTDEHDEVESMGLEMPEFKVPDQASETAAGETDSGEQEDAPTTERMSQEALEEAAARDETGRSPTPAAEPGDDNGTDDDASAGEPADDESADEEAADEEGEEYDRQAMVKTIQMDPLDRSVVEAGGDADSGELHDVLSDARFSPEIIPSPPPVLVKKWREGLPGEVELLVNPEGAAKTASKQSPTEAPEESDPTEAPEESDPAEAPEESDPAEAPEESDPAEALEESDHDEPTKAGATSADDDVEELPNLPGESEATSDEETDDADDDDDAEPIELDEELLELEEDDVSPPDSPPADGPPKARADVRAPKNKSAEPAAPKQGNSEMQGLVQELLEEEKEQKEAEKARPRDIWFKNVFGEEYLRSVPSNIASITHDEVDFIEESLRLKTQSRILDLACGFGRHSIELANRGYEMVGLDLSRPLLERALDAAKQHGLNIKFIRGDMRELNFSGIFDGCFIWNTSLGYFDDRRNLGVLQGVGRALKPGGRLLIDVINRDYVVPRTPTRLWWEGNGCIFLEESEFDYQRSTLEVQRSYIYEDGSPPLEHTSFIRLYNVHELRQMLHVAGFKVREVSGGKHYKGQFLGAASERIIVLAEKRNTKKRRKPGRPKKATQQLHGDKK